MASGLVESSVFALAGTAMTVALVHTLVGVDHYLPFIALSRAQNWSLKKTWFWTALCGLGHVLSSIVLAALASLAGWAATRLGAIDGFRGDMAAYFLIAFGIGYAIWGVWRLRKGGTMHHHVHRHGDLGLHEHVHVHPHEGEHKHQDLVREHEQHEHEHHEHEHHDHGVTNPPPKPRVTLWALFVIFVLGPCEPLIPLMVAPAVANDWWGAFLVVALFGVVTIVTMLMMVTIGFFGLSLMRFSKLERWMHPLAGGAIAISGGLILLGL